MATITFTETNCAATKQGRLLNLSGQSEQQHLYGAYVAKSLGTIKLQALNSYTLIRAIHDITAVVKKVVQHPAMLASYHK